MTNHDMPDSAVNRDTQQRRLRWGFGAFLAIALFFLWQEHRAHLLGALPWLLLLACPLIHRFMHGGHRSHQDATPPNADAKKDDSQKTGEHSSHGCH